MRRPSVYNNIRGHIYLENFQFTPITTQSPIGTLENVSTTDAAAVGWSADPDSPTASNFVDCYIDGTLAGRVAANLPGAGAPNPPYTGNHRFSFTIPDQYRNNANHQISCYGIDQIGGDQNALLAGSPKTFNLPPKVQSVVFEPVSNQVINGVLTNSVIDYPSFGSSSQRIFPDKLTPNDIVSRKSVRVKAVLSQPIANVTVYFKNFDVDDPSIDPIIDDTGVNGNDNREGRVIGQSYPPSAAGVLTATSATTNSNGEAIVYFTVTKQPGDNFVVAASTNQTYLNGVAINGTGLKDSTNNPLPTTQAKRTELLTSWRRVHIEVDSMGAVAKNYVTGFVRGKGTYVGSAPVWIEIYPATGPPAASGYFEENSYKETVAADGTRLSYGGRMVAAGVHDLKILDNRLVLRSPGVPPKSEIEVLSLNGNVYLYPNQPVKLFDDDDFNDSDGSQKDGDDGEDVDALYDTFSRMQASDNPDENAFASAYIVPEYVWATNAGYNDSNVSFILHDTAGGDTYPVQRSEIVANAGSQTSERDDFWIAYVLVEYQGEANLAVDPGGTNYGFLGGVAPLRADNTRDNTDLYNTSLGVPPGGIGDVIFIESMRDRQLTPFESGEPSTTFARTRVGTHEVGHQFGLGHNGGLPSGNNPAGGIMSYVGNLYFTPNHINLMRWRIKSPGQGE